MKETKILMRGKNFVRLMDLAGSFAGMIMLLLFLPSLCYSGAGVPGEGDGGAVAATTPPEIYVADFELEAADMESESGLLQRQREQRGRLGNVLPKPLAQKSPAVRARELVDLMADSLVKELLSRGFNARRVSAGETALSRGLLVRGVFIHADEGNRLRRAVIGLGAGETDLQVVVAVDDLSQGRPKPLYQLTGGAESSKLPGAIITMNPYAAAARFVLSKKDLDKNVRKTASKIAAEVARRAGR